MEDEGNACVSGHSVRESPNCDASSIGTLICSTEAGAGFEFHHQRLYLKVISVYGFTMRHIQFPVWVVYAGAACLRQRQRAGGMRAQAQGLPTTACWQAPAGVSCGGKARVFLEGYGGLGTAHLNSGARRAQCQFGLKGC
jgi:hypothetical protein